MKKKSGKAPNIENDEQASKRKEDHIDLAFRSAVPSIDVDTRFMYEPVLSAHPSGPESLEQSILGKKMSYPIWVSSMTGGTEKAKTINRNLARVCGEFGLGMGLGSCRQLLYDDSRLHEFDVADVMNGQPLCINLGIAQLEELIRDGETGRIEALADRLSADGLIVHINPLQEWLQPEGDRYLKPPIDTIHELQERTEIPLIIKEVGQGFGKESLEALLRLPVAAIDLAGFGGTNFAKLELLRSNDIMLESYKGLFALGHTCEEMAGWINDIIRNNATDIQCERIIFSGGIKNFLDGYYFINKCHHPSIYAQASAFLKYAQDYEELKEHVIFQTKGLELAAAYLRVKPE